MSSKKLTNDKYKQALSILQGEYHRRRNQINDDFNKAKEIAQQEAFALLEAPMAKMEQAVEDMNKQIKEFEEKYGNQNNVSFRLAQAPSVSAKWRDGFDGGFNEKFSNLEAFCEKKQIELMFCTEEELKDILYKNWEV